jgi:hypothetical protein
MDGQGFGTPVHTSSLYRMDRQTTYGAAEMTTPKRVTPDWQVCLICDHICKASMPIGRGWFTIKVHNQIRRVHFDCADWLKKLADDLRVSPVVNI